MNRRELPTMAERDAARARRNGFVYRVDAGFDPAGRVPPAHVLGSWAVDARGQIAGPFQINPNYGGRLVRSGA